MDCSIVDRSVLGIVCTSVRERVGSGKLVDSVNYFIRSLFVSLKRVFVFMEYAY